MLLITRKKTKKKNKGDKCFIVNPLLQAVRNNCIKTEPEKNNQSTNISYLQKQKK